MERELERRHNKGSSAKINKETYSGGIQKDANRKNAESVTKTEERREE